jgi:hypothetical protein
LGALVRKDRAEIALFDDVLGPDPARAQLAGSDPTTDRLGILANTTRCLWNSQHIVGYYYMAK